MRSATWLSGLLLCAAACNPNGGVHLAPPPASEGFQLAVPPFEVPAGQEIQSCYFFAVPGTPGTDVWVDHYQIAQTVGSHHMNLFRVGTVSNLIGTPGGPPVVNGECFVSSNWSDWPLVVNSQQAATTDWTLPDGVAAKFTAGELLMLQTHWVNAETQKTPGKAEVFVNLWFPKQAPTYEMGTMFETNQNIRICPGDVDKTFAKTCKLGADAPPAGVNVIAANGHFHSRGTLFEMMAVDPMGNVLGNDFYQSTTWDDPPMARDFTEVVPANGGVEWKCHFTFPDGECGSEMVNGQPTCCFTFGGHVETQEHCNAFVYYYPKIQDVNCF